MDKKQYDELRATFPWQEQTFTNGLVQVIDRNGEEVPLFGQALAEMEDADVVMVVGTSLQVYPAASLLQFAPHQAAVYLIDPQPQRLPGA